MWHQRRIPKKTPSAQLSQNEKETRRRSQEDTASCQTDAMDSSSPSFVLRLPFASSIPFAVSYFFFPAAYILKACPVWVCAFASAWQGTYYSRVVAVGLVFGSIGDILLEMDAAYGVDLFIPGLVSFLFGHLCYIHAFKEAVHPYARKTGLPIAVIFYAAVMSTLFTRAPGYMIGPIAVYGLVIACMAFYGYNRFLHHVDAIPEFSRRVCLLGSVSFVVSDTLLSFSKFYQSFKYAGTAVMITYYLGQISIATSTLGLKNPGSALPLREDEQGATNSMSAKLIEDSS